MATTMIVSPFAPAQADIKEVMTSAEPRGIRAEATSEFLDRLESCDNMLRKIEARSALLAWTSSVVGLPISHISQVIISLTT